MSLDVASIVVQIEDMAESLKAKEEQRRAKLSFALETIRSPVAEFEQLKQKIEASKHKTTWLVADPKERIDLCQPAPPFLDDLIIVASDGSHIDVDRHRSSRCFLINIGIAHLQYGQNPDASLSSTPFLYFKDDEVVISSSGGRQDLIEGQLLGIKRNVEECRLLVQQASELKGSLPVMALLDGSLILWGLAGRVYSDVVIQELLVNGFLKHLEELRRLNRDRQLAIASYISFPRSTDVVNALRVAICPYQPADCDRHCSGKFEGGECNAVAGLLDRDLFRQLLDYGERSALFSSTSSVVETYYKAHEVNFFYMNVGEEIARVEIPLWVAEDRNLLELTHSAILDQSHRGLGYPVALSEAHEKAIVTGADREQFWNLVEQTLAEDRIWLESSAKQQSKRTRWI